MTGDLYFFISSLPILRWGEKPPFTAAEFLDKCQEALGDKVRDCLAKLSLTPGTEVETALSRQWLDKETYLRNILAEWRAGKMRKNVQQWLHSTTIISIGERKLIEDALGLPNAWEKEQAIDQLRWQMLDELNVGQTFSLPTLEIYMRRLLLLEKQQSRQLEAGREIFTTLVKKGVEQAGQPDIRILEH